MATTKDIARIGIFHVKGSGEKMSLIFKFDYSSINPESLLELNNLDRYSMTLIKTPAEGAPIILTGNIPFEDLWCIQKQDAEVVQNITILKALQSFSGKSETNAEDLSDSPAYKVQLMLTAFKGRTPAEVLFEDPSKKGELLKGRDWLAANVTKYPANQKQIDAINDAVKLLEIGEIRGGKSISPVAYSIPLQEIYKRDFKYMSKEDAEGRRLIYSPSIVYDASKDAPYVVTLKNAYAPLIKSSRGLTNIDVKNAVNQKSLSIYLTKDEWAKSFGKMMFYYQQLETERFSEKKRIMDENSYSPSK